MNTSVTNTINLKKAMVDLLSIEIGELYLKQEQLNKKIKNLYEQLST